ncbi:MAG TPA: GIY-YIG nuclease family protein [Stellaceae bacterium]|nr:GIY-YIG nuclease family protein [Stellaceae bacterium]
MSEKRPCAYILASGRNGTLYVGATTNLVNRVEAHRAGAVPGFTRKYKVGMLVYAESHDTIEHALLREKQIKKWRRAWKLELIERDNPQWRDLFEEHLL